MSKVKDKNVLWLILQLYPILPWMFVLTEVPKMGQSWWRGFLWRWIPHLSNMCLLRVTQSLLMANEWLTSILPGNKIQIIAKEHGLILALVLQLWSCPGGFGLHWPLQSQAHHSQIQKWRPFVQRLQCCSHSSQFESQTPDAGECNLFLLQLCGHVLQQSRLSLYPNTVSWKNYVVYYFNSHKLLMAYVILNDARLYCIHVQPLHVK